VAFRQVSDDEAFREEQAPDLMLCAGDPRFGPEGIT
jgi:hypothetical protein